MARIPSRLRARRRRLAALSLTIASAAAIGLVGAPHAVASGGATAPTATASDVVQDPGERSDEQDEMKAKQRRKTVRVEMFRFQTKTLKVPAGTKVVWENRDQILHTVTSVDDAASSDDSTNDIPALIDGDLDGVGAKYAVRFTEPGTYDYFCMIHPVMQGRVVVKR